MNPLATLKRLRKALRLYNDLLRGETTLLVEYFPFVKAAFTPKIVAPPPVTRKPLPPPKISYEPRSEEEELRDALDVGFDTLKFDSVEDNE